MRNSATAIACVFLLAPLPAKAALLSIATTSSQCYGGSAEDMTKQMLSSYPAEWHSFSLDTYLYTFELPKEVKFFGVLKFKKDSTDDEGVPAFSSDWCKTSKDVFAGNTPMNLKVSHTSTKEHQKYSDDVATSDAAQARTGTPANAVNFEKHSGNVMCGDVKAERRTEIHHTRSIKTDEILDILWLTRGKEVISFAFDYHADTSQGKSARDAYIAANQDVECKIVASVTDTK